MLSYWLHLHHLTRLNCYVVGFSIFLVLFILNLKFRKMWLWFTLLALSLSVCAIAAITLFSLPSSFAIIVDAMACIIYIFPVASTVNRILAAKFDKGKQN